MSNAPGFLSGDIDLRGLGRPLVRWWWVVLLGALIGLLVAAGLALVRPPEWDARALVITNGARTQINTSSAVSTQPGVADPGTLRVLARSREVLSQVAASPAIQALPGPALTTAYLERRTSAESLRGTAVVELGFRDTDPQRAATVVQEWSGLVARIGNAIAATGGEQLVTLEEQVAESYAAFQRAQGRLETALASSRLSAVSDEIRSIRSIILADLGTATEDPAGGEARRAVNARIQAIDRALATLPGLRTVAAGGGSGTSQRLAFQAAVTAVYGPPGVEQALADATPVTAAEIDALQAGAQAVRADLVRLRERLATEPVAPDALYARLAALDAERSGIQSTLDAATEERNAAYRTWTALLSRREQARASAEGLEGRVQVAGTPVAPDRPIPAESGLLSGALLGALAGLAVVYGWAGLEASRRRRAHQPPGERPVPA